MLEKKLIPTPLIQDAERERVVIVPPRRRARFRSVFILLTISGWIASVLWLRVSRRLTRDKFASELRAFLERMGGIWIKVGQLLALRRDVFSPEFCDELAKLQDQANGFPFHLVRETLEREIEAPLDRYFDYFDETPIAAASIAQIHKARLRLEDVWVAVKVQRPYVEIDAYHDLKLIKSIFRFLHWASVMPYLHWPEMIWELEHVLKDEVDYRVEASSISRMKRTLRRHGIYVPTVFFRYSTKNVLVMEFIDGVFMSEYIKVYNADPPKVETWLEENRVDPVVVGRKLYHSLLRQLFEDNLFHGDLHPGNIVLLRNNRIALIDFGSLGSLEAGYQKKYQLFVKSLAEQEYARAVDLLFLLSSALPLIDIDRVKEELIRSMRAWGDRTGTKDLPYHQKSISNNMSELGRIMFKHKIWMDWSFLRINRTHLTLDASLMYLSPDANYSTLLRQYFDQVQRRELKRLTSEGALKRSITSILGAVSELPEFLREFSIFQGEIIRRRVQSFQATTSKFSYLFEVTFVRIAQLGVLAILGLAAVFMSQHYRSVVQPLIGEQFVWMDRYFPRLSVATWVLVFVVALYLLNTSIKLKRRFSQKDVRSPDD